MAISEKMCTFALILLFELNKLLTKYFIEMRKILVVTCLFVAGIMWATEPAKVIRAYMGTNGGYVLVNADNEVMGMSDNNQATEVSTPFRNMLENAGYEIQVVNQDCPAEILAVEAVMKQDSVGPLLGAIEYNQGAPYNNNAPMYNSKRCVTGCVATAMAQILAYWQWPDVCAGGYKKYQTKTLGLTVDYDFTQHAFDWSNMLPAYQNVEVPPTQAEKDAVADLMRACGVAVEMNYTTESSGSFSPNVPDALVKFFKFKKGLQFQERGKNLSEQLFAETLREDFKAGRPVYCSAQSKTQGYDGGHAFVIDGYKTTNPDDYRRYYFHFNFGWGGAQNLWYKMDDTENPYGGGFSQQVIVGIQPDKTTPLEEVTMDAATKDNVIRDIMGRPVSQTTAGNIYILNGDKFLAR